MGSCKTTVVNDSKAVRTMDRKIIDQNKNEQKIVFDKNSKFDKNGNFEKIGKIQTKRKHGGGVLMPKRNCGEQIRVRTVNEGFDHLREFVPCAVGTGRRAKISKVETLRSAMEYIKALEGMLGIRFDEKGERVESDSGNNSSDGSPPRSSRYPVYQSSYQNTQNMQHLQ